MFRQLSTVVLVVLIALGSLAVVTTMPGCRNQTSSSKPTSLPKELTFDLGNGVKLEMLLIAAGKFMMSSPDSDKDAEAERAADMMLNFGKRLTDADPAIRGEVQGNSFPALNADGSKSGEKTGSYAANS